MEIGSLANWISGIGSFSAAGVALYIAHRGQPINLSASCGIRVLVGGGAPRTRMLSVFVTNVGIRGTKITNIGIRAGTRKGTRRYALVMMDATDPRYPWVRSSPIPHPLADGDTGLWSIPLDDSNSWLQELIDTDFIASWSDVESFRFTIHNSHGRDLEIQPESPVRKILHDMVNIKLAAARA